MSKKKLTVNDLKIVSEIERSMEDTKTSNQPRFGQDERDWVYNLWARADAICEEVPPYRPDSRIRDAWLNDFAMKEDHLISVVNSVVQIDANRGWVLIGGRNQVRRFSQVLKNYHVANGTDGWRNGISASSRSFYCTDMNALVEVGRDGDNGPLAALYHIDPTKCYLTGRGDTPLYYSGTKNHYWYDDQYFRVASFPSIIEEYNGLGYCAVSRALNTAMIAYAVMTHDQESLAARAPKGLLLLLGITESQWDTALQMRAADLNAKERQYFGGVMTLATSTSDNIDAKLVALSQLPRDFSRKEWADLTMFAYALAFGYDPSEFWPVQFGSLGRGEEAAVQTEKAASKGQLTFALAFQEELQNELPQTIHFEFEERSDSGDLVAAEVKEKKADWIDTLSKMTNKSGEGESSIYSPEELRELAAAEGLIPSEWTEAEEGAIEDDEGKVRDKAFLEQMRMNPCVRAASEKYPDEPIVQYRWNPLLPNGESEIVIFDRGSDVYGKKRVFAVAKRQRVLFENDLVTIAEEDVDRTIDNTYSRDPIVGEMVTAEVVEDSTELFDNE